jgi:hypothetical protein
MGQARDAKETGARNAAEAINHASETLERATAVAAKENDADAEAARTILEEAREQLDQSRIHFDKGKFALAVRFAESSRRLSKRAIDVVSVTFDPESVRREIARTEKLLQRLRSESRRPVPPAARRAYTKALDLQRQAVDQFERGEFRRALKSTRNARRIAMRSSGGARSGEERETVARALRLTENMISMARERAARGNSARVMKRVDNADALQLKALKQFESHDYGNAFRLTLEARNELKDALARSEPGVKAERIRSALIETDKRIREARETLGPEGDRLLRDAQSEQDAAWAEFGRRRLRAAVTHTRASRDLVRKALGTTKKGNG